MNLRARAACASFGVVPPSRPVGEDPGSVTYVVPASTATVPRSARSRSAWTCLAGRDAGAGEAAIDQLNADPAYDTRAKAPLPRGIDTNAVLERIDPAKDADGCTR